jgi:hypothetical protein
MGNSRILIKVFEVCATIPINKRDRARAFPSRAMRELGALFGADRATIARWPAFWRDHIPQIPFWKVARARLMPILDVALLPLSLLDAFFRTKDPYQDWLHLLRFLSPLTIPGGPAIEVL